MAHINQQFDTNLNMGGDSESSGEEDDSSPSVMTHVYGHGCTITEEVEPVPEALAKKARRADPVPAAVKAEAKLDPVPAAVKAEAKAEPKKLSLR